MYSVTSIRISEFWTVLERGEGWGRGGREKREKEEKIGDRKKKRNGEIR